MALLHTISITTTLALALALAAQAQTTTARPPAPRPAASAPAADHLSMMDMQLKAMRNMHDKMLRARTAEERNALMAEHTKLMQDGMAMMGGMKGMPGMGTMPTDIAARQQMIEKRMEMMQSMMQMMMDRMPAAPPSK